MAQPTIHSSIQPGHRSTPELYSYCSRRSLTIEMKLRRIIPGQVLNLDQLHYIAPRNKQQDTHPVSQAAHETHQHGTITFCRNYRDSDRHSGIDRCPSSCRCYPTQNWSTVEFLVRSSTPIVVAPSLLWQAQDNNTAGEFRFAIYCIVKCRYFVTACFRCCFVSTLCHPLIFFDHVLCHRVLGLTVLSCSPGSDHFQPVALVLVRGPVFTWIGSTHVLYSHVVPE